MISGDTITCRGCGNCLDCLIHVPVDNDITQGINVVAGGNKRLYDEPYSDLWAAEASYTTNRVPL